MKCACKSIIYVLHFELPLIICLYLGFFRQLESYATFLFQNIDVDQIVEHYQTNCTPQPSVSRFPSTTPVTKSQSLAGHEETNLPPELSINCNHGLQVIRFLCFNHVRSKVTDIFLTLTLDFCN